MTAARPLQKLSVILPCYNEKSTVLQVIDKVAALRLPVKKELLIVCDGSTDGTKELLRERFPEGSPGITVIYHRKNLGKGAAVRTAAARATGDYLIVQDADLELDPEDYAPLLAPVLEGRAEVVFGSRALKGFGKLRPLSLLANRIVTTLTNLLYGSKLTDQACGYKLLPLELFRKLDIESSGFEFCAEIAAKILKTGRYPITEVDVNYHPRSYEQGKKIKWLDGFVVVWTLLKQRFLP
ncbi:MAG: Glycosyltransferases involved in cell wall bioproteini [Elusimicrobia bacterium]|nr:MAG: Glycosyltransferases involved in cell wall bioproteini [Elusimicrobiota bacterium]KAF0157336.1 MAG: Glycosyltransferases involved in cell wall bioproteini [Elusimicrobiota bacterium]